MLSLEWSRYYEIDNGWNMLLGFPGERLEDCQQQIDWIRCIPHLQPPGGCGKIWLERFSPYYTRPDLYPVSNVRPEKSYYYVYPPEGIDIARIAYFFDYSMGDTLTNEAWQALGDEVAKWKARWDGKAKLPTLTYKKAFDFIFVADNRWDRPAVYPYSGASAAPYLFCETRKPLAKCLDFLREQHNQTEEFLNEAIATFIERRLMIREDNLVLSLCFQRIISGSMVVFVFIVSQVPN